MNRFITLALTALMALAASARKDLTYFWGSHNAYIDNQTEISFDLVNELLDQNPPKPSDPPTAARRAALQLIDGILHDARLDSAAAIAGFMDSRMEHVLADLDSPLTDGIRIYKLYNSGVIVRTPSVTMAWDIYRGPCKFDGGRRRLITDSVARALVDRCHIMFLTHNHRDHVDPDVIGWFTEAGKPVVAPSQIMPENDRIIHARRDSIWHDTFVASNGACIPCVILPGHQDHLENNIVIATTPEGYTACQTGDQWLKADLDWVLGLRGRIPAVDVLMPNCWAARLPEFVESFAPSMVLTMHENELGHSMGHREALWLSLFKTEPIARPCSVMAWGEIVGFTPAR